MIPLHTGLRHSPAASPRLRAAWVGVLASPVLLGAILVAVAVVACCAVKLICCRRRRKSGGDEDVPLLGRADSPRHGRDTDDIATIGTPPRDFVRISSLPPSIFRVDRDQRRCLACGEAGKCVALRPCGHVVLCRPCSDYVYTCPNPLCGKYITGVGSQDSFETAVEGRDR